MAGCAEQEVALSLFWRQVMGVSADHQIQAGNRSDFTGQWAFATAGIGRDIAGMAESEHQICATGFKGGDALYRSLLELKGLSLVFQMHATPIHHLRWDQGKDADRQGVGLAAGIHDVFLKYQVTLPSVLLGF